MSWIQHSPGVWTSEAFSGFQLTTERLAALPAFLREEPPKFIGKRQNPAFWAWRAKYGPAGEAALYGGKFAELVALNDIKAGGNPTAAVAQAKSLAAHSGKPAQFPQLVAMLAQAGYTAAAAALSQSGAAAASQLAPTSSATPGATSQAGASNLVPVIALALGLVLVVGRRRRR